MSALRFNALGFTTAGGLARFAVAAYAAALIAQVATSYGVL